MVFDKTHPWSEVKTISSDDLMKATERRPKVSIPVIKEKGLALNEVFKPLTGCVCMYVCTHIKYVHVVLEKDDKRDKTNT